MQNKKMLPLSRAHAIENEGTGELHFYIPVSGDIAGQYFHRSLNMIAQCCTTCPVWFLY